MAGIRSEFDELMKQFPQSRYNEFNNLLELANKFGSQAVRNKLQNKPEGPTSKLSEDEIFKLLNNAVGNRNFKKDVDQLYLKVQQQFSLVNSPRAKPAIEVENTLDVNSRAQISPQLRQHPALRNLDEAADPKVREAAIRAAARNIAKDPASFTEQYSNVVRAAAEQRLANKLRMSMPAPAPKRKVEPRPGG